jgi:L-aminopeptidase/D-esterase-like protein
VAAAVVYDLFLSRGDKLPDANMGYEACLNAREDHTAQGNVGAGAGVTLGKWAGPGHFMKGGYGQARVAVDNLVVFAAAVVNSIGDVVAEDGTVIAGARAEDGSWLMERNPMRYVPRLDMPTAGTNTTLVVVGTNARLTKLEANRVAQRAHDGIAIAVRPAHMTHEGDAAFALSTEKVDAPFELVANAAVGMVVEAIRNAVRYADSVDSILAMKDMDRQAPG